MSEEDESEVEQMDKENYVLKKRHMLLEELTAITTEKGEENRRHNVYV